MNRVTVVLLNLLAGLATGTPPPLLSRFLLATDGWLEACGSVVLTYEAPEGSGGAGRRTDAFDPSTGAWFSAGHSFATGRTPEGVIFAGEPERGGLKALSDQRDRLPAPMQDLIPISLAAELRRTEEGLVDISTDADGNWIIEYVSVGADPERLPRGRIAFSADGIPLRLEREADPSSGRPAVARDYSFEPESTAPLLVAARPAPSGGRRPPLQLVSVQYYSDSRPELFAMERVEALAIDNRIRTQMQLNQLALRRGDRGGADGSPPIAPYVRTRLSRAGWPLVVTGIIVVAIGLIAIFRARMAR